MRPRPNLRTTLGRKMQVTATLCGASRSGDVAVGDGQYFIQDGHAVGDLIG